MTTVAREELNKLSSSITECNVIYLPQVSLTSIDYMIHFLNLFLDLPILVLYLFYIFTPQLGYLLAIPRSPEMKEEHDFAIDGLEFVVRLVTC